MPSLAALCHALGDDLTPAADVPLPAREVTGVHVSELTDPTPYLQGGELLLTTGMSLTGQTAQTRAYTARLRRRGVAALGLGLGPVHDAVPEGLVRACEAAELPLLVVPAPTPFLVVARTYWTLLARAGQEELSAALGAHRDLVRAAAGPDPVPAVVRVLAGAVAGWAAQLTPDGDVIEVWPQARRTSAQRVEREVSRLRMAGPHSSATFPVDGDDVVLHPLSSRGRLTGFVATGCPRPMQAPDRQLVLTACALLALQSEQQLRGSTGPRSARACVARLLVTGFSDAARSLAAELAMRAVPASVRVLGIDGLQDVGPEDVLDTLESALQPAGRELLVLTEATGAWALLSERDVAPVLGGLRRMLAQRAPTARVLISAPVRVDQLPQHVAALRRTLERMPTGAVRDLSAPDQTDDGRAETGADVLEGLLAYHRADLLGAVTAYLRHRGRWESAARDLGVHRNTLRHRIATATTVLGADLDDPDVASRTWLALRAAGLA